MRSAPNRLPALSEGADGKVKEPGTIVLSATQNFRVTIEGFGQRAFVRLFEHFNPQDTTRNTFELRVNQAFDRLHQLDEGNRREERAERRFKEDQVVNPGATLAHTFAEITERDRRDSTRTDSPLKIASDAIFVDSTDLSIQATFERMMEHVHRNH